MILKPNSIPKIFLKPGEMHFAVNPTIVTTVLGSCIAVTMYSKELHTGAICHAILPEELMTGDPYRYVDSSIRAMLQRFQRHGIKK
ncbi:MAG TPA: chemotaxis protein CheD, partial [Geobacteraceae bacterium]|nr:chemotaxis protein CheD [Geobacteraceae bacterium]